jgi:hypothetical protein
VKVCTKCNVEKTLDNYSVDKQKKEGIRPSCKQCDRHKNKLNYYKNIEKCKAKKAEWRAKNLDYFKEYRKVTKKKYKKNRAVANAYSKRRKETDPGFKLRINLGIRVSNIMRRISANKPCSIVKAIGCTTEELKNHIESLFQHGMNWENYGRTGWHVDHIVPLCKFDLTKEGDYKKANHFSNLQPLWAVDNLRKGGR